VPAQHNGHAPADVTSTGEPSGFGSRGRLRRRTRFLRKARELAYRDLGGLVFNLHRFGQRNDPLVLAKLTTVAQIDTELRTLETALGRREPVTVLREAGINACPRCAAIHSSEDRFCPNCGLPMDRHVDLPIAGVPAAPNTAVAPNATVAAPTPSQPAPNAAPSTPAPPAEPAPIIPESPASTVAPVAAPAAGAGRAPHPPGNPSDSDVTHTDAVGTPTPSVEDPTEILRPPPR
jgi:hypothetical protein